MCTKKYVLMIRIKQVILSQTYSHTLHNLIYYLAISANFNLLRTKKVFILARIPLGILLHTQSNTFMQSKCNYNAFFTIRLKITFVLLLYTNSHAFMQSKFNFNANIHTGGAILAICGIIATFLSSKSINLSLRNYLKYFHTLLYANSHPFMQ